MSSFSTKDILKAQVSKLRDQGMSIRAIAQQVGVGKTTVGNMLISEKEANEFVSEINSNRQKIEFKPKTKSEKDDEKQEKAKEKTLNKFMEGLHDNDKPKESFFDSVPETSTKQETLAMCRSVIEQAAKDSGEHVDTDAVMKELGEKKPTGAKRGPAKPRAPRTKAPEPDTSEVLGQILTIVNTDNGILANYFQPDKETYLKSLNKLKEPQLQGQLKMLTKAKIVETSAGMLHNGLRMASLGIETITQRAFHMQTRGYAQLLEKQAQDIRACLKEIAFENADKLKNLQSPTARLAMLMSMSLLQVDMVNRAAGNNKPQQQQTQAPKPEPKPEAEKKETAPAPAQAPAPAKEVDPLQSRMINVPETDYSDL
jgi:hypothetical protein